MRVFSNIFEVTKQTIKRRDENDAIERELYANDPKLAILWKHWNKSLIKGKDANARRERFEEYVQENPEETDAMYADIMDKEGVKLGKEQEKYERAQFKADEKKRKEAEAAEKKAAAAEKKAAKEKTKALAAELKDLNKRNWCAKNCPHCPDPANLRSTEPPPF